MPLKRIRHPFFFGTVAQQSFTVGQAKSVGLAQFVVNPEGRSLTYSLVNGPSGFSVSGANLNWSGAGLDQTATVQVQATDGQYVSRGSVPVSVSPAAVVGAVEFATIPEIAFIEEFADAEELGIFVVSANNRPARGSLWWESPLTDRLTSINGANFSMAGITLETVSGSQPAGVTYNSATGRLEYSGAPQPSRVVDWTVRLVSGTSQSAPFRIRILRPTVVWGIGADTAYAGKWSGDVLLRSTATFQVMQQSGISSAATDALPNVVLCLGGVYDRDLGSEFFLGADKPAVYLLGDPTSRPIWKNDLTLPFDTYDVSTRDALLYMKNIELQTMALNLGPSSPLAERTTRIFLTRLYVHTDKPTISADNFAGSNQEADGGGTNPPSIIAGVKEFHAWNIRGFNVGADDLHHMFYLHGRPGGAGYFNNLHVLGAEGCQIIKSTLPVLEVRNCYLQAMQDRNNLAVGERSNNLIDQVNPAEVKVWNCHLVGAYNPNVASQYNGPSSGLIFFRARREFYGCDSPAYPNLGWQAELSSMINNGYMPQPDGWSPTPATYMSSAFWAAAQSGGINAESNPYLFRHWIERCTFEWIQEPGGREQCAIRNDGTYPRIFLAPKQVPSVFLNTHPDWFERSVDFVKDCEFYGWSDLSDTMLFDYAESEASDPGPPLVDNIPIWPQDGGVMRWPRTTPEMFPRIILSNISRGNRPDTVLANAADALTSGFSAPLDIPTLGVETARTNPEDTLAYPDTSSNKRTWHWQSKWCWDSVGKKILAVHSPHIETDNLRAQLLSVYDEASNTFVVHENPIMRSVGHGFDTNGIDVAGRRLYKWTVPRYYTTGTPPPPAYAAPYDGTTYETSQYIQPQLCVLNLDAGTFQDGAGLVKEIPRAADHNNVTAPAIDFVPGVGVAMFHKDRVWILDATTDTWSSPFVLSFPDGDSLHNVGHYNPTANLFVFGGGSYSPNNEYIRTFYKMDPALPIGEGSFTRLDDAPVAMSVNNDAGALAKCCATYIPDDVRSVFFHQDGNVYILNPTAAPGSQWTTITGGMAGDPSNGSNDDRWCCAIPDYGVVAVGHFGWTGTSKIRLWKP